MQESAEPPRKPLVKKPLFWIALLAVMACMLCAAGLTYVAIQASDLLDFNEGIEAIGSAVPELIDIATQVPEIEDASTLVPEIEKMATEMPAIEDFATEVPALEKLITDLPLPGGLKLPTAQP